VIERLVFTLEETVGLSIRPIGEMRAGDIHQSHMEKIQGPKTILVSDHELKPLLLKSVCKKRYAGIAAGKEDAVRHSPLRIPLVVR
jgi:hypothetical protein